MAPNLKGRSPLAQQ